MSSDDAVVADSDGDLGLGKRDETEGANLRDVVGGPRRRREDARGRRTDRQGSLALRLLRLRGGTTLSLSALVRVALCLSVCPRGPAVDAGTLARGQEVHTCSEMDQFRVVYGDTQRSLGGHRDGSNLGSKTWGVRCARECGYTG